MGGTILRLAYGAVSDGNLDFAELSKVLLKAFDEATAGHLVDAFPICKYHLLVLLIQLSSRWHFSVKYLPAWMPGAGFKRKAVEWKKIVNRNFKAPFEMVKRMKV